MTRYEFLKDYVNSCNDLREVLGMTTPLSLDSYDDVVYLQNIIS